jgi:phosphatidylglycerol:prolipoprotein diacylglycerol transferase
MNTPDVYFPNLGIKIDHLSRVAFTIFGYDIYKYGAIICVGVIFAIMLVYYEAKRTGQNPDNYTDFVFWGLLAGVAGARLYYMIFHTGSLKGFFAIREGGLAIYGGIIGAVIAIIVYTRVKKLPLLLFTDTAAMSLLVGQIIGRWGNLVNREAFGGPTEGLFALAYKAEQVSGLVVGNDGTAVYNGGAIYPLYNLNGTDYIWVHPTFLYESCWNIMILAIIFFTRKHKKFDGQLTATYFLGYGIGRFIIESMRTDQLKIFGVPVSMLLSAVLATVSLVFIGYKLIGLKQNRE